jgi:hypothetical protein
MVAGVTALTARVLMVKSADVAPAGIETLEGGIALGSEEVRFTSNPPVATAPFKVTVPLVELPPETVFGEMVRLLGDGGVMVNLAVAKEVPEAAFIVAANRLPTGVVVMLNVAVIAPDATVTVCGGTAARAFELRVMTIPADGAGADNVTVPVDEAPPTTVDGETERAVTVGGVTVRITVA